MEPPECSSEQANKNDTGQSSSASSSGTLPVLKVEEALSTADGFQNGVLISEAVILSSDVKLSSDQTKAEDPSIQASEDTPVHQCALAPVSSESDGDSVASADYALGDRGDFIKCGENPKIVIGVVDEVLQEMGSCNDEDLDPLITIDDTESQSSDLINLDTVSYDVIHQLGIDDDDDKSIATVSSLSCDIKLESPTENSQASNSSSLQNLLESSVKDTSCIMASPSHKAWGEGMESAASSCPSSPSLRSLGKDESIPEAGLKSSSEIKSSMHEISGDDMEDLDVEDKIAQAGSSILAVKSCELQGLTTHEAAPMLSQISSEAASLKYPDVDHKEEEVMSESDTTKSPHTVFGICDVDEVVSLSEASSTSQGHEKNIEDTMTDFSVDLSQAPEQEDPINKAVSKCVESDEMMVQSNDTTTSSTPDLAPSDQDEVSSISVGHLHEVERETFCPDISSIELQQQTNPEISSTIPPDKDILENVEEVTAVIEDVVASQKELLDEEFVSSPPGNVMLDPQVNLCASLSSEDLVENLPIPAKAEEEVLQTVPDATGSTCDVIKMTPRTPTPENEIESSSASSSSKEHLLTEESALPPQDPVVFVEKNVCDVLVKRLDESELRGVADTADTFQGVRTPSSLDSAVSASNPTNSDESAQLKSCNSSSNPTKQNSLEATANSTDIPSSEKFETSCDVIQPTTQKASDAQEALVQCIQRNICVPDEPGTSVPESPCFMEPEDCLSFPSDLESKLRGDTNGPCLATNVVTKQMLPERVCVTESVLSPNYSDEIPCEVLIQPLVHEEQHSGMTPTIPQLHQYDCDESCDAEVKSQNSKELRGTVSKEEIGVTPNISQVESLGFKHFESLEQPSSIPKDKSADSSLACNVGGMNFSEFLGLISAASLDHVTMGKQYDVTALDEAQQTASYLVDDVLRVAILQVTEQRNSMHDATANDTEADVKSSEFDLVTKDLVENLKTKSSEDANMSFTVEKNVEDISALDSSVGNAEKNIFCDLPNPSSNIFSNSNLEIDKPSKLPETLFENSLLSSPTHTSCDSKEDQSDLALRIEVVASPLSDTYCETDDKCSLNLTDTDNSSLDNQIDTCSNSEFKASANVDTYLYQKAAMAEDLSKDPFVSNKISPMHQLCTFETAQDQIEGGMKMKDVDSVLSNISSENVTDPHRGSAGILNPSDDTSMSNSLIDLNTDEGSARALSPENGATDSVRSSILSCSDSGLRSEASLFVDGILEEAVRKSAESSSSDSSPVKLRSLALDSEFQEDEELATPCGEMLTEHFMDFESGRNVSVFCSLPESGSDDHLLAYDRIANTIGNREVDSDTGKSLSVFRIEEDVFYEVQRPSTCTSVFESVEEEDEDMIDTTLPIEERLDKNSQNSVSIQSSECDELSVSDEPFKMDNDAFEDAVGAFLSKERVAQVETHPITDGAIEEIEDLPLLERPSNQLVERNSCKALVLKYPEYDLSNQEEKRKMAEKWANGGELEVPDTPEMREKQQAIREALDSDEDVAVKLCQLALTEGGLINDALRKEAWPRMLGLDPTLEISAPTLEDLKLHPEYEQVVLDVNRSLKRFPPDIPKEQRETLQDKLTRLIMYVISKHPHLRYYQGYHDVAVTFLLVVGESIAFQIMERLSIEHLSDCMQPTMERTSYLLHFIYPLLHRLHPTLAEYLERSEVGTMFCLPWFLTWFGHSLDRYQDVVRLYDHFLASPPLAPLYVAAVLVAHRADEVLAVDCDMAAIHALLSHIPDSLPLEILLRDATKLYMDFPPESIESEVEERFRNEQDLRVHEMEARERMKKNRELVRHRPRNRPGSGSWQLAEFQDRVGGTMMVLNRWMPPWVVQQQRLSMRFLFASATFFVGFYVYSRGGDMLPYL